MFDSDFANAVERTVLVGGASKAELLSRLEAAGVQLNELARRLFDDPRFSTGASPTSIRSVELAVADLGLPEGGTFARVSRQAFALDLLPCPLELGPHLRLRFLDQREGSAGQPSSANRAPPGSVTVVSLPLDDDDETPKGFYLRRIDGSLWLRAYRSWAGHVWSPEDRLVFAKAGGAT